MSAHEHDRHFGWMLTRMVARILGWFLTIIFLMAALLFSLVSSLPAGALMVLASVLSAPPTSEALAKVVSQYRLLRDSLDAIRAALIIVLIGLSFALVGQANYEAYEVQANEAKSKKLIEDGQ